MSDRDLDLKDHVALTNEMLFLDDGSLTEHELRVRIGQFAVISSASRKPFTVPIEVSV